MAADVELRFYGISDLHRGFFADPRFVDKLGKSLGACISGTAQVVISYDSENWIGRLVLKVPPGTQHGQRFRIAGHGIEKNGRRGDQFVEVRLEIPAKLTDDAEAALRAFADKAGLRH